MSASCGVCPDCGAEVLLHRDRVTDHRQALMSGGQVVPGPLCDGAGRPSDVDVSRLDRVVATLVEVRIARNLTAFEVARIAGVERDTIANMEAGRSVPSLRILRAVATALDCDIRVEAVA